MSQYKKVAKKNFFSFSAGHAKYTFRLNIRPNPFSWDHYILLQVFVTCVYSFLIVKFQRAPVLEEIFYHTWYGFCSLTVKSYYLDLEDLVNDVPDAFSSLVTSFVLPHPSFEDLRRLFCFGNDCRPRRQCDQTFFGTLPPSRSWPR
jgi:hypothetical protein